jgi:threonine/homoserine/homoserine lactone efflux protein
VALAVAPLFVLSSYPFELDLFLPLLMMTFALATVWLIPLFGWVVIGCAAILALLITVTGLSEFDYLYGYEQAAFVLAYVGLAYLVWFSWRALRGRFVPPLVQD